MYYTLEMGHDDISRTLSISMNARASASVRYRVTRSRLLLRQTEGNGTACAIHLRNACNFP